jgi:hypothetical protein
MSKEDAVEARERDSGPVSAHFIPGGAILWVCAPFSQGSVKAEIAHDR